MTLHRTTPHGPAHLTIAGRAVCCGSASTLPAGDAPLCRQCARWQARNTKGATR